MKKKIKHFSLLFISIFIFATTLSADTSKIPPDSKPAPTWTIEEWMNSAPLNLEGLRGKVVILEFFQLWCPGCNSFSIPLMDHWYKLYGGDPRIQLVSIHSVFEGHAEQTPRKLRTFIAEKEIPHPVGIDAHLPGESVPLTMRAYKTQGTPEIVIIDKKGNIRFQRFGAFNFKYTENLIESLMEEQIET